MEADEEPTLEVERVPVLAQALAATKGLAAVVHYRETYEARRAREKYQRNKERRVREELSNCEDSRERVLLRRARDLIRFQGAPTDVLQLAADIEALLVLDKNTRSL